jgi:hypothetical protein
MLLLTTTPEAQHPWNPAHQNLQGDSISIAIAGGKLWMLLIQVIKEKYHG